MVARPQACPPQPLNDTLNLRPKSCVSSWPSRYSARASAAGVTSKLSSGQTPAMGPAGARRPGIARAAAQARLGKQGVVDLALLLQLDLTLEHVDLLAERRIDAVRQARFPVAHCRLVLLPAPAIGNWFRSALLGQTRRAHAGQRHLAV